MKSLLDSRSILQREKETIIEGILVPRLWKSTGEVTALALNTLDEREYFIEDPRCEARNLIDHLRKRVRLAGTVFGNRVVRVTSVAVQDYAESFKPKNPEKESR